MLLQKCASPVSLQMCAKDCCGTFASVLLLFVVELDVYICVNYLFFDFCMTIAGLNQCLTVSEELQVLAVNMAMTSE